MSSLRPVLLFTAGYMLAALAAVLVLGNYEFLFYIAATVVIGAGIGVVHARVGLTIGLIWALSIWGAAHMAGGLVALPAGWPYNPPHAVLYSWWLIPERLKYDHVVHFYGFGVTTFACWQGLCAVIGAERRTVGVVTLAVAGSMGFGALNEIVEFAATLMVPETNVGGYVNTGWDLVANLSGALVAGAVIFARAPRDWSRT